MNGGKITLYIAASVDGFIAAEDGGVSWLEESLEETGDEDAGTYEEFVAGVDCLVMGSKTYEQVLGFGEWPYGEKPTYVVTRRELPRANDDVELCSGEIRELAQQFKQQYGHIWLVGGAQLAQSFLRLQQIDEIQLSIIPVLLGRGIPLVENTGDGQDLMLRDTTTHKNGIVELHYRAVPSDQDL